MEPSTGSCRVKKKLTDRYAKAIIGFYRSQCAQLAALRRGEGFLYDAEITQAREEVDKLKQAISNHQREHGC